jgi:hypothetical protein
VLWRSRGGALPEIGEVMRELLAHPDGGIARDARGERFKGQPRSSHPRGGTTDVQSVLLPKAQYPTPREAAAWLRDHNFRAREIEDSGKVREGRYWRARQYDPRPGYRKRTIPFGDSGILAVTEARGPRRQR